MEPLNSILPISFDLNNYYTKVILSFMIKKKKCNHRLQKKNVIGNLTLWRYHFSIMETWLQEIQCLMSNKKWILTFYFLHQVMDWLKRKLNVTHLGREHESFTQVGTWPVSHLLQGTELRILGFHRLCGAEFNTDCFSSLNTSEI